MAEIKPAEISAILRKQVEGFESAYTRGSRNRTSSWRWYCSYLRASNVQYGELVEFDNGLEAIVLNLEEDNVGVVLLGPSTGIKEGSTAKEHNVLLLLK
jgi:F-type H+-transporting ATPase subunit alpha